MSFSLSDPSPCCREEGEFLREGELYHYIPKTGHVDCTPEVPVSLH